MQLLVKYAKKYAIIAQICKNMQLFRKYAKYAIITQKCNNIFKCGFSHLLKDLNNVILFP